MMNGQGLIVDFSAFILSQSAILTGKLISPKSFTSLGVPIGAMPVSFVAVDKVGCILPCPMLVAAFSTAILSRPFMVQPTLKTTKFLFTVKASKVDKVPFWSVLDAGVLASRGAMFTSAVLHSAWDNVKDFLAVSAYSRDLDFHYGSKIKPLRRLGAVVEAATHRAIGEVNRIIANMRLNKKMRPYG